MGKKTQTGKKNTPANKVHFLTDKAEKIKKTAYAIENYRKPEKSKNRFQLMLSFHAIFAMISNYCMAGKRVLYGRSFP